MEHFKYFKVLNFLIKNGHCCTNVTTIVILSAAGQRPGLGDHEMPSVCVCVCALVNVKWGYPIKKPYISVTITECEKN